MTTLYLVGLGADNHLAAVGLERPKADCRAALPAHPLFAYFFGSAFAVIAPRILDKFKLLLIQAMGSSEGGNVSQSFASGRNKIGSPGLPWGFDPRSSIGRALNYQRTNRASF